MSDIKAKQLTRNLINILCKTSQNIGDVETLLETLVTPVQFPTSRTVIPATTTGTISDGFKSFTVSNIGITDALLDGSIFPSGWSETYSGDAKNETVAGMSYDSQATTLIINTVG